MSGIINEDELMEKMKIKQEERINKLKAALVEKIKLGEDGNQKGTKLQIDYPQRLSL